MERECTFCNKRGFVGVFVIVSLLLCVGSTSAETTWTFIKSNAQVQVDKALKFAEENVDHKLVKETLSSIKENAVEAVNAAQEVAMEHIKKHSKRVDVKAAHERIHKASGVVKQQAGEIYQSAKEEISKRIEALDVGASTERLMEASKMVKQKVENMYDTSKEQLPKHAENIDVKTARDRVLEASKLAGQQLQSVFQSAKNNLNNLNSLDAFDFFREQVSNVYTTARDRIDLQEVKQTLANSFIVALRGIVSFFRSGLQSGLGVTVLLDFVKELIAYYLRRAAWIAAAVFVVYVFGIRTLALAGFKATGIAARSIASVSQSLYYGGQTGGLFSYLQSLRAKHSHSDVA